MFNSLCFESSWFLIQKHREMILEVTELIKARDQGLLWQNQTKLTKGSIKTKDFLRKTVVTNFRFAYINWPSWKFISTLGVPIWLSRVVEGPKIRRGYYLSSNNAGTVFDIIWYVLNFEAYGPTLNSWNVLFFLLFYNAFNLNNQKILCLPSIYQFERKLGFWATLSK